MGQRSQLIVRLPELFYNDSNPNNKPERIKVYHNQWLYGINFIKYLARLIRSVEHLSNKEGTSKDYGGIIDQAVKHCNYADIDYMTNTHDYFGEEERHKYNMDLNQAKNVLEFLNSWDNNNGYMYLVIDSNGKMEYCILNGTENNDDIKIRTPKEYVNLFYADDKIEDETELQEAIKFLDDYPTIDIFEDLKQFKKKVEKMMIKEVAEIL